MAEEAQIDEGAGEGETNTLLGGQAKVEGDPNAAAADAAAKAEEAHLLALDLAEKPEGIPDDYYDAEGKKLHIGKILKRLSDAQTALRNKAPKAPEKYEAKIPEDLKGKVELDLEGEGLKAFNELAKKHNLSQETYDAFLEVYLKEVAGQAPDPEAQKAEIETHKVTLAGPNYFKSEQGRDSALAALTTYLSAHLTKEQFAAVSAAAATPDGIMALNKLRVLNKETALPSAKDSTISDKEPTHEELVEMMKDERYIYGGTKFDPDYYDKVKAAFEKKYNTA